MSHEPAAADSLPPARPAFSIRAYLQLFRLPNVFTAMADVSMGYFFTLAGAPPLPNPHLPGVFWSLLAASSLLYTAGMVLNDVYDIEVDARERPHRPLPSGRIPLATARWLGYELLLFGMAAGCWAGYLSGQYRSCIVTLALAAAVVGYDRGWKRTRLGPLVMGSCRFLNVLLGMSAASFEWHAVHWLVAAGIGVYIVGVTWFARTEATESNRRQLTLATAVILAGMGLLASLPWWVDAQTPEASRPVVDEGRWLLAWGILAFLAGRRCVAAISDPSPAQVQAAVKNCIFSLILLDAICCFAVRGPGGGMAVAVLIVPTMLLGRWVYST